MAIVQVLLNLSPKTLREPLLAAEDMSTSDSSEDKSCIASDSDAFSDEESIAVVILQPAAGPGSPHSRTTDCLLSTLSSRIECHLFFPRAEIDQSQIGRC